MASFNKCFVLDRFPVFSRGQMQSNVLFKTFHNSGAVVFFSVLSSLFLVIFFICPYSARDSASGMFASNAVDTFDALLRKNIYG